MATPIFHVSCWYGISHLHAAGERRGHLSLSPVFGRESRGIWHEPVAGLIAASEDPAHLTPASTWYMTTSLSLTEASAEQIYELYRLRDWIEHYYEPAKHELGWADFQVRPAKAILRHWHLVMLAYTFSLLAGAPQPIPSAPHHLAGAGGKSPTHLVWQDTLRQVRTWLCPWARLLIYWRQWSTAPPPAELAAMIEHVAQSRPLAAPI